MIPATRHDGRDLAQARARSGTEPSTTADDQSTGLATTGDPLPLCPLHLDWYAVRSK